MCYKKNENDDQNGHSTVGIKAMLNLANKRYWQKTRVMNRK